MHGIDRRLRAAVIAAISARQRNYRVVYNSPNVPASLRMLDERNSMPELPEVEVALVRSKHSKRSAAVDAMHEQVTRSLGTTN